MARKSSGGIRAREGLAFSCAVCDKALPPGEKAHRRRTPWGSFMCSRHGGLVQKRAERLLVKDPFLAQCCRILPTFLWYCSPSLLKIREDPPPFYPEPVLPFGKPQGAPAHSCCVCKAPIAERPPRRRLGEHSACGPCGRQYQRERARRVAADRTLKVMVSTDGRVLDYIRPEVRMWASPVLSEAHII